jgi:acid stress chaperone HdeB
MKCSFVLAALCCSSLLLSMPVYAKKPATQNIDFGAITCSEFMKELSQGSAEDAGVVLMWIDGYLSGVSGDTVLKWSDLEKFSANLMTHCGKKPDDKVLEAAKAVGIAE